MLTNFEITIPVISSDPRKFIKTAEAICEDLVQPLNGTYEFMKIEVEPIMLDFSSTGSVESMLSHWSVLITYKIDINF